MKNSKVVFRKSLTLPTLLIAVGTLLSTTTFTQTWSQLGIDIDGEASGDQSGFSVSTSANGLTVAIGACYNDGNGSDAGHVRVYKMIAGTWTQQGADIDGEDTGDNSGVSVSLSADGLTVAIGAHKNGGNGNNAGHVRIYKMIAGIWTQQGADIDGEAAGDFLGYYSSVSLSEDGLTVALGAHKNDNGNGSNAGHVRIYKMIAGTWTQQGADIDGEGTGDNSGTSVSLSADGLTVAVGAHWNDGNGIGAGHVRVYKIITGTWTRLGTDIDGEAAYDDSGHSVSLSTDGLTIAIGAFLNDNGNGSNAGHVRIYKMIAGTWTQQGADIDGEATNDFSGRSVSLSADGLTVAIGAYFNDGNGSDAGHVRVYKMIAGTWTQQGVDIDGEDAGNESGHSVSLSADGLTVVIGAPGNGSDAGHVRVYKICSPSTSTYIETACNTYTWIDGNIYTANNTTATHTLTNIVGCDSVVTLNLTINTVGISVTESSPTLTANATTATYHWLDCNNSFAIITGKTNQTFTATTNGNYAVEVTENGCTDTSACYVLANIDPAENSFGSAFIIYPNPTNGQVYIELGQIYNNLKVKVTNAAGQEVSRIHYPTASKIQLQLEVSNGVYFVEIQSENQRKIIEVIKQ